MTYEKYIEDVENENIITNKYIKLAVKRFKELKNRDDIYFDEDNVKDVHDFISNIRHFKGQLVNKNFELLPWQSFMVAHIFGLKYKSDNKRITRTSFLFCARKNGKSAFLIAIEIYLLFADAEASPEIVLACRSREQSKDVLLNTATMFIKSIDKNYKYHKSYRNDIITNFNNGKMKIVSSDTNRLDGYNCSSYLIDEYHSFTKNDMYSVLQSSMGARNQPLSLISSTAGFNLESPCKYMCDYSKELLMNLKSDDSFFPMLYMLDDGDDWTVEKNWYKSNPSINITNSVDYIKSEVLKAKNIQSEEVGVKTKTLNIWCASSQNWISHDEIIKYTKKIDLKKFIGQSCYVGVDLASTEDMTAVSYMFNVDGKYYFYIDYYVPQNALNKSRNKTFYMQMYQQKHLHITPGNTTDYNIITNDILKMNEKHPISRIFYDSYNSVQWAIDATAQNLPLEIYSQSISNFNRPTKEFVRLLYGNKVVIDNNPINIYCFTNAVIMKDHNENEKPKKSNEKSKIDGVIATLEALGGYLLQPKASEFIVYAF